MPSEKLRRTSASVLHMAETSEGQTEPREARGGHVIFNSNTQKAEESQPKANAGYTEILHLRKHNSEKNCWWASYYSVLVTDSEITKKGYEETFLGEAQYSRFVSVVDRATLMDNRMDMIWCTVAGIS